MGGGGGGGGGEERAAGRQPLVASEISPLTEVASTTSFLDRQPSMETADGGRRTANDERRR